MNNDQKEVIIENCIKKLSAVLDHPQCPECGAVPCNMGCHDEDEEDDFDEKLLREEIRKAMSRSVRGGYISYLREFIR